MFFTGNKSKALKILEKALLFEAKPAEDLKEAIKCIKEGKQIVVDLEETSGKMFCPFKGSLIMIEL